MKFSRLGLLGDIHAEASRLEVALKFFETMAVEQVLCVGDITDGVGEVNACCRLLQEANVCVVRGNHDRWLLENQMRDLPHATQMESLDEASLQFLRSLPHTQTIKTVRGLLLLCHGVGANDMCRLTPDDYGYALECNDELQLLLQERQYRFVVGGHTHYRMVRDFGPLTFINPGTLHTGHKPCVAVADFEAGHITFHNFQDNDLKCEGQVRSLC